MVTHYFLLTGPLACHVPSKTPGLSACRPRSFSQAYLGLLMRRSEEEDDIALSLRVQVGLANTTRELRLRRTRDCIAVARLHCTGWLVRYHTWRRGPAYG